MTTAVAHPPELSIVVPVYNEEDVVGEVVAEILAVLDARMPDEPWELLLVDDGSSDATPTLVDRLSDSDARVRALHLMPNSGQSAALEAGFRAARGTWIGTLDGDGQNDPADLPVLLGGARERAVDMLCGVRARRSDNWWRRLCSRVANRLRARVLGDGITDVGCSMRVFRRACIDRVRLYRNAHRFLPALFQMAGFTVDEVPVNHRPRRRGVSKYGGGFNSRAWAGILDLSGAWWLKYRALRYEVREYDVPSKADRPMADNRERAVS